MKRPLSQLLNDDRGATAIEYGLIISLIVVAMIGALSIVAGTTSDMWSAVKDDVTESEARVD